MFPSQQLYQKTLYYQQEYCTISKYGSYLCSLMLILFLSLTLPGLTDASSHTARETHHRESRRSRRDSGTTADQPGDLNTHHWPRGKTPLSRFCVFRALPLILYIVFDIVLCHYLLLYIRIVLVFLLISYIAFVR